MPSRLVVYDGALDVLDRALLLKAKPSILTEDGFLRAMLKEANALRSVVTESVDDLMARVRRSTRINWPKSTPAQRDRIIEELGNLLKGLPSEFAPGVSVVLDESGKAVVEDTKKATAKKHKKLRVDPTFNLVDEQGVQALRETTSMFFGQEYEKQANRFRKRAQKTIADGLEQGFGRVEIARNLQSEFRDSGIHEHYWTTVAAVHTNRARSFSSAATYLDAGVTEYEIVAVMDERTTPICEFMDGKTFSLGPALDQFTAYEAAEDLDEVRNKVMPFMRVKGERIVLPSGQQVARVSDKGFTGAMSDKKLNEAGIHMPPYHFGCRTTVIPIV